MSLAAFAANAADWASMALAHTAVSTCTVTYGNIRSVTVIAV